MRTETVTIYKFSELSDSAKQRAIEWIRCRYKTAWDYESYQSIQAFCNHFGVTLKDYQVDEYSFQYAHDATNDNWRGIKLKDFNRDHAPTGYFLDFDLWMTFYDEFKRTGSAAKAFDAALEAGFEGWRNDIEWQYSDEHLGEYMECNEYEFTEDGSIY